MDFFNEVDICPEMLDDLTEIFQNPSDINENFSILKEMTKMDMNRAGCGQLHHSFDTTFIASNVYLGYAAECEGDNLTREGKINKIIKLLAASDNPNDFAIQCAIYDEVGIDSDTFTDQEIEYIQQEVAKRL